MHPIIAYFNQLESQPLHRMAFLVIAIMVLWLIEGVIPLATLRYKNSKGKHAAINFLFTLFHLITHAILAIGVVKTADWCKEAEFGLVHWLGLGTTATVIVGLLSMDFFGGWLVHITEHKIPLFWRMHIVHHADNKVDVSTGLRHHPLEALFRWVFFMLGVIIMGLPIYAIMIGQTWMSLFTMFTHANIALPEKVDKALSRVLVSPNMHKVHHHYKQPYTDSNYGTSFSIWDRMFGTFMYLPPAEIKYGLDRYYKNEEDENIIGLLKSPFYSTIIDNEEEKKS